MGSQLVGLEVSIPIVSQTQNQTPISDKSSIRSSASVQLLNLLPLAPPPRELR